MSQGKLQAMIMQFFFFLGGGGGGGGGAGKRSLKLWDLC